MHLAAFAIVRRISQRPVIVVTGGGRGIGASTAKLLAALRGLPQHLHGREPAEDVVRYIGTRNGQAITPARALCTDIGIYFRCTRGWHFCFAAKIIDIRLDGIRTVY